MLNHTNKLCFHFHLVLWSMCYLEMYCSISVYFGIFQLPFCYEFSNLIPLWSESGHYLSKIFLIKVCFLVQNVVCFGDVSYELEENAYSSIVQWCIDINYIQLIDGIVEFSYVLTDFLPTISVCFWDGDVGVSNSGSRFVYSFLQFCLFLPHFIWYSVIRNTHIENYVCLKNVCLYDYIMRFFLS